MASLVTMAEIARIAGVTRQAVTNWRSRQSAVPFPIATSAASGIEKFDRDEVLDWLEATGRGRNDEARLDAPAVAVPEDLAVDMVVVTHEVRFAREVADRVVFMDEGVVVEQGPPEQVLGNPEQPRTRQFLSMVAG